MNYGDINSRLLGQLSTDFFNLITSPPRNHRDAVDINSVRAKFSDLLHYFETYRENILRVAPRKEYAFQNLSAQDKAAFDAVVWYIKLLSGVVNGDSSGSAAAANIS